MNETGVYSGNLFTDKRTAEDESNNGLEVDKRNNGLEHDKTSEGFDNDETSEREQKYEASEEPVPEDQSEIMQNATWLEQEILETQDASSLADTLPITYSLIGVR